MAQRGIVTDDGRLYLEVPQHRGWFTDGKDEFELINTDLSVSIHQDIESVVSTELLTRVREAVQKAHAPNPNTKAYTIVFEATVVAHARFPIEADSREAVEARASQIVDDLERGNEFPLGLIFEADWETIDGYDYVVMEA